MPLARATLFSTASLVTIRSLGVGARMLSLLTLAAGMPVERFGHYAIAFVLSEFARCVTDFGLDPIVLRRAEELSLAEQRPLLRAALAVRGVHGLAAGTAVLVILAFSFPMDLLMVAAGLQFLAQGLLQLGLNWRQVNNSAHRAAPMLLIVYSAVIGLSVTAYFTPGLGGIPLPLLLAGEFAMAVILLAPLSRPRVADIAVGYARLVPQALPMAGIMFLAFVNTRTDALLVSRLVEPEGVGRYLYLARWIDLVPMLATGIALPLVGKVAKLVLRRSAPALAAIAAALAIAPFVVLQIAAYLNPAYAGEPWLRALLAALGSCRVGLSITTMLLLAQWHDRVLMRATAAITIAVPILAWSLGSRFGAVGLAGGVLIAETANLLFQTTLLLKTRAGIVPRGTGNPDER